MINDVEIGAEQDRLDAARISGQAHFIDVRLVRSTVELDHFPEPGNELTYRLTMQPTFEHDEGHNHFVVRTAYLVEIVQIAERHEEEAEDEPEDDVLATLDFEYGGLFVMPSKDLPTTAELGAFARTTGTFALFPHAREYTNSTTGRMGIPPLTLDLLKISLPNPSQDD